MEEKTIKHIKENLKDILGEERFNKIFFYNLNITNEELGHLLEEIEESENYYNFKYVKKSYGQFQDRGLLKVFVDQRTGYECDDFEGEIYIMISENRWLTWEYSM